MGLGMSVAFGPQADFGGITSQKNLRIDLVLPKAWVKVAEKGTKAAAGIAVLEPVTAAMPPLPVVFKADHHFLLSIQDQETDLILFCRRLSIS